MRFKILISIFTYFILFGSTNAHAIYAAIYKENKNNLATDRPTHILVSTEGQELANLPYEAALTQALYIKKQHPTDQVIIISDFDLKNQTLNQLNIWNLDLIFYSRSQNSAIATLSSFSLVSYMKQFTKIKSFHIYGHSNIPYGARLFRQFRLGRFESDFQDLAQLRKNFAENAYAILSGCNSGWSLAIKLSEVWQIPVAGSFTGTVFEKLGSDRNFHLTSNKQITFAQSNMNVSCYKGACIRQVPQNTVYNGHYGSYETPSLNFLKFFCKGMKNLERCYKGMATAALNSTNVYSQKYQSTTLNEYKNIVSDILCRSEETGTRQNCFNFLSKLNTATHRTSFFMNSKYGQLNANFEGHDGQTSCTKIEGKEEINCTITSQKTNQKVDTMAREFEAYMMGFNLLKKASNEVY